MYYGGEGHNSRGYEKRKKRRVEEQAAASGNGTRLANGNTTEIDLTQSYPKSQTQDSEGATIVEVFFSTLLFATTL